MPDEKERNQAVPETADLRASLLDAWEQIHVLSEETDDLGLRLTAMLNALAQAVPSVALEYERAYKAIVESVENSENELPPNAREAFRRLRNPRT